MSKLTSEENTKEILAPSLDEEHVLYNTYWYEDQIVQVLSGEIALRPEIYPIVHRLDFINDVSKKYNFTTRWKNKGLKRKYRGTSYRLGNKGLIYGNNMPGLGETDGGRKSIGNFIKQTLPTGTICKETYSNIYLLCPFHNENTPSLCIGKARGGHVKCFGCGQSMLLSTFLSKTLWHTRKYRHDKMVLFVEWKDSPDPNQLKIPFPEDTENGSV